MFRRIAPLLQSQKPLPPTHPPIPLDIGINSQHLLLAHMLEAQKHLPREYLEKHPELAYLFPIISEMSHGMVARMKQPDYMRRLDAVAAGDERGSIPNVAGSAIPGGTHYAFGPYREGEVPVGHFLGHSMSSATTVRPKVHAEPLAIASGFGIHHTPGQSSDSLVHALTVRHSPHGHPGVIGSVLPLCVSGERGRAACRTTIPKFTAYRQGNTYYPGYVFHNIDYSKVPTHPEIARNVKGQIKEHDTATGTARLHEAASRLKQPSHAPVTDETLSAMVPYVPPQPLHHMPMSSYHTPYEAHRSPFVGYERSPPWGAVK
jgi:hypothetical protein